MAIHVNMPCSMEYLRVEKHKRVVQIIQSIQTSHKWICVCVDIVIFYLLQDDYTCAGSCKCAPLFLYILELHNSPCFTHSVGRSIEVLTPMAHWSAVTDREWGFYGFQLATSRGWSQDKHNGRCPFFCVGLCQKNKVTNDPPRNDQPLLGKPRLSFFGTATIF